MAGDFKIMHSYEEKVLLSDYDMLGGKSWAIHE